MGKIKYVLYEDHTTNKIMAIIKETVNHFILCTHKKTYISYYLITNTYNTQGSSYCIHHIENTKMLHQHTLPDKYFNWLLILTIIEVIVKL